MTAAAIIELAAETVKPFGTLKGTVRWQRSDRPPSLELRVFWMTRGRGTEEVEVVTVVPGKLEPDGTAEFSIKLPGVPWSFSGQLISVSWAVELVDDQGVACGMESFVLSPDGEVRQLKEVNKPKSKKKAFGFKSK